MDGLKPKTTRMFLESEQETGITEDIIIRIYNFSFCYPRAETQNFLIKSRASVASNRAKARLSRRKNESKNVKYFGACKKDAMFHIMVWYTEE
jgi:hypothetical protein